MAVAGWPSLAVLFGHEDDLHRWQVDIWLPKRKTNQLLYFQWCSCIDLCSMQTMELSFVPFAPTVRILSLLDWTMMILPGIFWFHFHLFIGQWWGGREKQWCQCSIMWHGWDGSKPLTPSFEIMFQASLCSTWWLDDQLHDNNVFVFFIVMYGVIYRLLSSTTPFHLFTIISKIQSFTNCLSAGSCAWSQNSIFC